MRIVVVGLLSSLLALPAYGQSARQKACEAQAGNPTDPNYEMMLRQCMRSGPGPRAGDAGASARDRARLEARRDAAREEARKEARREAARDEARRQAAREKARRDAAAGGSR